MTSNPISVTFWWTPDCGYLHAETDPVTLDLIHCPDGVPHWSLEDEGSPG